jgi:hypothetical protein
MGKNINKFLYTFKVFMTGIRVGEEAPKELNIEFHASNKIFRS